MRGARMTTRAKKALGKSTPRHTRTHVHPGTYRPCLQYLCVNALYSCTNVRCTSLLAWQLLVTVVLVIACLTPSFQTPKLIIRKRKEKRPMSKETLRCK